MLLLNKANLRVSAFASKEASRYTLQAIHVSDKGTVATDGHRLVRVSLPTAKVADYPTIATFPKGNSQASGLLPLSLVEKLEKSVPTKETIPILNYAGVSFDAATKQVHTVTTDLDTHQVMTQHQVEGNFPNVDAVIPNKKPAFEICFNADALASLLKGAAEFTKDNANRPVKLRFYDNQSCVRIDAKAQEGQEWVGILMPIPTDGEYPGEYQEPKVEEPTVEVAE